MGDDMTPHGRDTNRRETTRKGISIRSRTPSERLAHMQHLLDAEREESKKWRVATGVASPPDYFKSAELRRIYWEGVSRRSVLQRMKIDRLERSLRSVARANAAMIAATQRAETAEKARVACFDKLPAVERLQMLIDDAGLTVVFADSDEGGS